MSTHSLNGGHSRKNLWQRDPEWRHRMMRPRILKKLFKIYEWISTPLDFVMHNQKQFFKNTYHSLDSDLLCTTKSSTESRHNGKSTNGILKNNDKSIKIFGLNLPRKTREFKYCLETKKNQACQQL